ncbi:MAG: cyclic nucleotide-binding domain-containing protein [Leptospiraceae bacterium]|nr:cyclic nucleotide-binding domain-containing protein [Leptospiraceae bacterium]
MHSHEDIQALTKGKILFDLEDSEVRNLARVGEFKTYSKGTLLLEEGITGDGLFIILDGEATVFLPKNSNRISEIKIIQLNTFDCFGEYSLIDEEPASASVIVRSNQLRTCLITKNSFKNFADTHHKTAKIIYKNLLELQIRRLRKNLKELDLISVFH